MPPRAFFVTGTDTNVGKTVVTAALLHAGRAKGLRANGMKPVASGCTMTADGLRNADALALMAQNSTPFAYETVNPCAYEPAIAPHIAAAEAGRPVNFDRIGACFTQIGEESDLILVEGAGGWLVPLGDGRTMADLAGRLWLGVVLVVGLRLGCLNHAFLTAQAVSARGLRLAGWVANTVDPDFDRLDENLAALRAGLAAPCLGHLPQLADPTDAAAAAAHLDVSPLLA
jgi:dethiobiotin synthetase